MTQLTNLRGARIVTLLPALLLIAACSTGLAAYPVHAQEAPAAKAPKEETVPFFNHVAIVMEENRNYSSVIGNPSVPYLNGLAKSFGLATNFIANTHPSIGNYFMLTTGQIITNDDNFTGVVTADNIVRLFASANISWKAYLEDIPASGYLGGNSPNSNGPYVKHHNPFAYFSEVVNNSAEQANMVPMTQLAIDIAKHTLAQYMFIVPNILHDSHDASVAAADSWLQANINPLLRSPEFQTSGLLIVDFDENEYTGVKSDPHSQIPVVLVSPSASKTGFESNRLYHHQSILKTMLLGLGFRAGFPGLSESAPGMGEFFRQSE